jgi:hypothetical protein
MSRPIRASKQCAIENIKKFVAEMNTYDDNGVLYEEDAIPHTGSSVNSTKITLEEVEETFAKSSYTPKILALIPTQFRNDLVEGDARIGDCIDALTDILVEYYYVSGPMTEPMTTEVASAKDYVNAYNFYRHYSEEAIEYILNLIEEFEEGQEYDEDENEDDDFMEKHYPTPSRSYADKPDPELIKALMGAAYTPEAFAKIMKNN